MEILQNYVAFSEYMNFKNQNRVHIVFGLIVRRTSTELESKKKKKKKKKKKSSSDFLSMVPSLDDDDAGCRAVGAGGGQMEPWPPKRGNRLCPPHY